MYSINMEKTQDERTFLRERFLRMLGSLSGTTADVTMQEKTKVSCQIGAADVDFLHLHVSNLKTPMGLIPQSTLRSSDIVSIKLNDVDVLKGT